MCTGHHLQLMVMLYSARHGNLASVKSFSGALRSHRLNTSHTGAVCKICNSWGSSADSYDFMQILVWSEATFETGSPDSCAKFDHQTNAAHMKIVNTFLRPASCLMLIAFLVVVFPTCTPVNAQNVSNDQGSYGDDQHDPDFPAMKRFNAGLMATYADIAPPPAVIGDLTYRFNRRFAAGLLAGTTGAQSLTGLKFNALLYKKNDFKLFYRMIAVYYPGRRGEYLFDDTDRRIIPWILSMATLDGQLRSASGVRYSLGIGLLETHCAESMRKFLFGKADERKIMPVDLFHTFQTSASIPISQNFTLRPELVVIMKNGQLIPSGKFKVFPINPFIKVIYSF